MLLESMGVSWSMGLFVFLQDVLWSTLTPPARGRAASRGGSRMSMRGVVQPETQGMVVPRDMAEEWTAGLGASGHSAEEWVGERDIARALGSSGLLASTTGSRGAGSQHCAQRSPWGTSVFPFFMLSPRAYLPCSCWSHLSSSPDLLWSGLGLSLHGQEVPLTAPPSWEEVHEEEQVCKR